MFSAAGSICVLQRLQAGCNKRGGVSNNTFALQACNGAFYRNARVDGGILRSCNAAGGACDNDVFLVRVRVPGHAPTGSGQPGKTPGKKQIQVILKF
jgi:hypothetical protein